MAAFEKFADYVPRQEEASWLARGKRITADRIEWVVMPDGATAAAGLQTGEVEVGDSNPRSGADVAQEPQRDRGHPGSAGECRHRVDQSPVPAVLRCTSTARDTDGDKPAGLYAGLCR